MLLAASSSGCCSCKPTKTSTLRNMQSLMKRIHAITLFLRRYPMTLAAALPFVVASPTAAEDRAAEPVLATPPSAATTDPSAHVFQFKPGTRYEVTSSVLHVTDIALEPGEQVVGTPACGDTARWVLAVDTKDSTQQHVFVKPIKPGLATNLIIRTNRRTYLLELHSEPADAPYMFTVQWSYPAGSRVTAEVLAGRSHT